MNKFKIGDKVMFQKIINSKIGTSLPSAWEGIIAKIIYYEPNRDLYKCCFVDPDKKIESSLYFDPKELISLNSYKIKEKLGVK